MAEARKGIRWMAWHEEADEGRESLRKVSGRWQLTFDPGMSEWGNPIEQTSMTHNSIHRLLRGNVEK